MELAKAKEEIARLHSLLLDLSSNPTSVQFDDRELLSPTNTLRETPALPNHGRESKAHESPSCHSWIDIRNQYLNVGLNSSADISPSFGPKV